MYESDFSNQFSNNNDTVHGATAVVKIEKKDKNVEPIIFWQIAPLCGNYRVDREVDETL